jgi:hypothetical protein
MTSLAELGKAVYYFFTEDGSVVVGAMIALILVGIVVRLKPLANTLDIAGPLLFVLIAALLIANLWRTAERSTH